MLLHRLATVLIPCAAVLAARASASPALQGGGEAGPATARQATPPTQAAASAATRFSDEQLDQIAAPIALYPDEVLSQVLMASTYPLEIVEAARWLEKNPKLSGEALENALKGQDWDLSVKALCGFAPALERMNEDLDWTQDLGDAFLGQREELMAAIQRMRGKAKESGHLESTKEQTVTQQGSAIVIESASPEVIYVPSYSPTVVYGAWAPPYPYYAPMYAPPPPGYGAMSFTFGVAWGAAVWGDCDWNSSDVDIDINRHEEFNVRTDRDPQRNRVDARGGGGTASFRHDPEHRRGVNYRDPATAQRVGGTGASSRVPREQARGYDSATFRRPADRTGAASEASAARRTSGSTASGSRGASASSASSRGSSASRASSESALRGTSSPSLDRQASTRGASSRGSAGARAGGGRAGGGRGGGRGR